MTEIDPKQVDKVYKIIKDKANKFSKEELELAIIADGYSKEVAKEAIKKIGAEKEQVKTKPEDKEKILAEISKSLKESEKGKLKAPKKVKKGDMVKSTKNFFKKIYYFFEDLYYSMIDKVDKVIPISKTTDSIDKVFPSFILFIIFIIGLIWLIFFSGVLSGLGGARTIEVTVTDTLDVPISGATVILSINDINETIQTDAFGTAWFDNFIYKKNQTKLIIEKQSYKTIVKELKLKSGNNSFNIKLGLDTTQSLYLMEPRTRTLVFKENETLLATRPLQVTLRCANSGKIPDPSFANVSTGQLIVEQVEGCGDLRLDVLSDYYNPLQNIVVPESNTIMLTLKSNNSGKIEVYVKDQNSQAVIPNVLLQLYKPDDTTTPAVNESNIPILSGTTDVYGRYIFTDLSPGDYTISAGKDGYISADRFGPYVVTINSTTPANINLTAGNKFINVILVDSTGNTTRIVKGDIVLYKKSTDSNNFSEINRAEDVNQTRFALLSSVGVRYKIAVLDTAKYGYFQPTPVDVNNFDGNITITIPLEYSSSLNSGIIGVHVERDGNPMTGAAVYLYQEDEEDIPISGPQTTLPSGDCNFTTIRAGQSYYAFAIQDNLQGQSSTEELDVNDFLELNVSLEEQAKILNLKVTPTIDYNISFFDSTGDPVTNYSRMNTSADSNKEYVFRDSGNEVYAIVSATGKATYQTDIITLNPGQKVYRTISLATTHHTAYSDINYLGVYDETGTTKITQIDLANDLGRTLKLKFKLTTSNKADRAETNSAFAYIRAGDSLSVATDIIKLKNVFAPGATETVGCVFSGQTADWNYNHYNAYYQHPDHDCPQSSDGFKWVQIDFSESEAEQIEFSVNMQITGITDTDYMVYSKALTQVEDQYVLDPTLNASWRNCSVVPNGYFYSPYNSHELPLANTDYGFVTKIYDYNLATGTIGALQEKDGSRYNLSIDDSYYYGQKLVYLKHNTENGDINAYSINTLGGLIYRSYSLFVNNSTGADETRTGVANSTTYNLEDVSATYATQIDHNAVFSVTDFFTDDANISTKVIGIDGLDPYNLPVLSYLSDSNIFIQIITNDVSGNNDLYYGDNNISFKVKDKFGNPISGIHISVLIPGNAERELGITINDGSIPDQSISLKKGLIGYMVHFKFSRFPLSYGLSGNQIIIAKGVKSGYKLFLENKTEIADNNPIQYFVGRYYKNGISIITKDEEKYFIYKDSENIGRLNSVNVHGDDTTGGDTIYGYVTDIDIADVNNYIYNNNIIPRDLSDLNSQINTRMALSTVSGIKDIFGGYHNIINVGTDDEGRAIALDLDAPLKTSVVFDINLNTELSGIPKPGVKQRPNGPLVVELIKTKSPNVTFNYIVTNNTTNPVSVDVSNVISDELEDYITVSAPNSGNVLYGHPRTIAVTYDLNPNAVINTKKTGQVTINFNYTINGLNFTDALTTEVNLYDVNNAMIIGQNSIINMTCTSTDCSTTAPVTFTNATNTYDFNLANIRFVDSDSKLTIPNTNYLPIALNSGWTVTPVTVQVPVSGDYDLLKPTENTVATVVLRDINKNFAHTLKINGLTAPSFDRQASTMFHISVFTQTLQETLEENGLFGNLCLGVGGIDVNEDSGFYILGNCDTNVYNDCKSGEDAKPKILYGWKNNSVESWSEECIDSSAESYDVNKTHCDSAQMLFSIFSLISNSANGNINADGNKYIYLMSDGVSNDLLSDYVNNVSFIGVVDVSDWNNGRLTDASINSGNLSIRRLETANNVDVNSLEPGKYQIILNPNFVKNQPGPLHITLKLVREMPYDMRNLLYYMPIDGKLGITGIGTNARSSRIGYGSSLTNDSNLPVMITGDTQNDAYLYPTLNLANKSRTKITLYNNENNLSKVLRSEGKLLDMTLDSIDDDVTQTFNITMSYSPSYPIPIYAKVVNSNNFGLSYKVNKGESTIPIDSTRFLVWTDYLQEDKILNDGQYYNGQNLYQKTMVDATAFRTNYGITDNSIRLLKTMLYWPALKETRDFATIKLLLANGTDNLGNDTNSKIYTLANLENNGSTDSGVFSQLSRVPYNSSTLLSTDVEDMYNNYINSGKACIRGGLTTTTIRWVDSNVSFTTSEIEGIISDSGVNDNSGETGETQH